METVDLLNALGEVQETVEIPDEYLGAPYQWIGRSFKTDGDRKNEWWKRKDDGSSVFAYFGTESRSHAPGPYFQLDE